MPFLRWVEDNEATGQVAAIYAAWRQLNPGRSLMPEILKWASITTSAVLAASME